MQTYLHIIFVWHYLWQGIFINQQSFWKTAFYGVVAKHCQSVILGVFPWHLLRWVWIGLSFWKILILYYSPELSCLEVIEWLSFSILHKTSFLVAHSLNIIFSELEKFSRSFKSHTLHSSSKKTALATFLLHLLFL